MKFEKIEPKDFIGDFKGFQPKLNLGEFTEAVEHYTEQIEDNKSSQNEDGLVPDLKDFFERLGCQARLKHKHTGKSEIDLALLKDEKDKEVEVIIETKHPNKNEFPKNDDLNCKALHECILYYLNEREEKNNYNLKHIIITNFYQFYIFKASEFERCFYKNKKIKKLHNALKSNSIIKNTEDFYRALKKGFRGDGEENLSNDVCKYTTFDLDLRDEKTLTTAHRILSRAFLYNEKQSELNALNRGFYNELLHILGLKENAQKGRATIDLINSSEQKYGFARHIQKKLESEGHLKESDPAENTENREMQESTMRYLIIWLNRILFLKLIEAHLLSFNENDKNLRFLTSEKISRFDTLSHLFFEVLAKNQKDRDADKDFNFLPYLNSSLFTRDNEQEPLNITDLDSVLEIKLFKSSILKKDESFKDKYRGKEKVKFLAYLFDFLACYDFGKSEDSENQEKNPQQRDLINSSVLGLIFEKLNAYKEGSHYTPNSITSHICKTSLERIVIKKFNAENPQWNAKTLKDIKDEILNEIRDNRENQEKIKEKYKNLLEGIKICDPAVGSGHFLVSALNEMIRIYYELRLCSENILSLDISNDELIINENFKYKKPKNIKEPNHIIQQELFNLKKTIIENNLFGVDINPISCEITRLRLWIELLKNSYYNKLEGNSHDLETLPNIDINIKCGNSLVSYFDIKQDLTHYPNIKANMEGYKQLVWFYKERADNKKELDKKIKDLQESFKKFCFQDKFKKELKFFSNMCDKYAEKYSDYLLGEWLIKEATYTSKRIQGGLYGSLNEQQKQEAQKDFEAIKRYYNQIFDIESYHPFEWRFAFPEVLNENGAFEGFDCIMGNPPYIRHEGIKDLKPHLERAFSVYTGTSDIYTYFYELGAKLLKHGGILNFITSDKYTRAGYGEKLREFLLEKTTLLSYVELGGGVFESATVDTSILEFCNQKPQKESHFSYYHPMQKSGNLELGEEMRIAQSSLSKEAFIFVDEKTAKLKEKIERHGTPLKDWDISIYRGVLTGYNEAFIIDSNKREEILSACDSKQRDINGQTERERTEELIKPILRGRDIKRYSYEWADLWLINTHNGYTSSKGIYIAPIDINNYPTLKAHFDNIANANKTSKGKGFSNRDDKGITPYNLRNCAYLEEFAKPKIIYSEIVRNPQFYLDDGTFKFGHFYAEATSFILTGNKDFKGSLTYLLGILHSKLITYAFKSFYAGGGLGTDGYRYKKAFIEHLPIPKLTKKKEEEFTQLIQKLIDAQNSLDSTQKDKNTQQAQERFNTLESKLNDLVFKLYGLSDEEVKLIGGGGQNNYCLCLALLLLSNVEAQCLELVSQICENFESKLMSAFRFCEGLKEPKTDENSYEPKLIWAETTQIVQVALDKEGMFLDKTAFMLKGNNLEYLNAIFASKIAFWYFKQLCSTLGTKGLSMSKIYIEQLPIPQITEENESLITQITAHTNEILKHKQKDKNANTQTLEERIDELVYSLYGLNTEEKEIIKKT